MRYQPKLPEGMDLKAAQRSGNLRADFVAQHVQAGWPQADAEGRYSRWAAGELEADPEMDLNDLRQRVMPIRRGHTLKALRDLGNGGVPTFKAGELYPVLIGGFSFELRIPPGVTVSDPSGNECTVDADQVLEFVCLTGDSFDDYCAEVGRLLRRADGARLSFEPCGSATEPSYHERLYRVLPGGEFEFVLNAQLDPSTSQWRFGATPILPELKPSMVDLHSCKTAAEAAAIVGGSVKGEWL